MARSVHIVIMGCGRVGSSLARQLGRAAGLTALDRAALGGLLALATYNLIARSIARAVRDTP